MEIANKQNLSKGIGAQDYIQDGIVELWDAIENNGWRSHSYQSGKWKGLIHGVELWNNFDFDDDAGHPTNSPWMTQADNILNEYYTSTDNVVCFDVCASIKPTTIDSYFEISTGYGSVDNCGIHFSKGYGLRMHLSNSFFL